MAGTGDKDSGAPKNGVATNRDTVSRPAFRGLLYVLFDGISTQWTFPDGVRLLVGRSSAAERPPDGSTHLVESSHPWALIHEANARFDIRQQLIVQVGSVSRGHVVLERQGELVRVTNVSGHDRRCMIDNDPLPHNHSRWITSGTALRLGDDVRAVRLVFVLERHTAPETLPMRVPDVDDSSELQRILPEVYHEQDFLRRFLLVFEALWQPYEWRQDHIELYFDPRICPKAMLPWLAEWFGVTLEEGISEPQQRQLVAIASKLYRNQGTLEGLRQLLTVCLGIRASALLRIEPDPQNARCINVILELTEAIQMSPARFRERLEELIQRHKPAHMSYHLEILLYEAGAV